MEWIHWRSCGILIMGAYLLDITSANTFMREREFQKFYRYTFTTGGESWQRAYDACYSEGLQLAVLDEEDQDLLDTWDGLPERKGDHAWIAGRRLEESGWMWANGDLLSGTSFSEETNMMCGILQGGRLKAARCVVEWDDQERRALCQKPNDGGSSYSLTLDKFTSWVDARTRCCSQQGRDMAHAHSGQSVQEFLGVPDMANMAAEDSRGVWVGVCQNCWSWVTENQTRYQPMDYFHFVRGQGSSDGEDCLLLELGGESPLHWADKACNSPSQYFLCEKKTTRMTAPAPTWTMSTGQNIAGSMSSDPQATPGTAVGRPSTTPEVPSKPVLLLSILVPSVVVVVLVIVVTVLVIRRRRAATRGHKGHETSSPPDISPYAEIGSDVTKPRGTGAHGDSDTSNDVKDSGNTRSSVGGGHLRGPEGDVYAIPATLKWKDRKSDHLEMQDNTTYGGW